MVPLGESGFNGTTHMKNQYDAINNFDTGCIYLQALCNFSITTVNNYTSWLFTTFFLRVVCLLKGLLNLYYFLSVGILPEPGCQVG